MKRTPILLLLVFMFFSGRLVGQAGHDGDWWRGLSTGTKQSVITGFLDGMALGQNLSLMGAGTSSDADCRSKIAQSYSYVRNRFFVNLGAADLVTALDQLYAEEDNSSIIIGRAVWIAANRLGGTKQDEVEQLIVQSRGMRY